ncbi:MAG: DUF5615 family PIN-like protein [Planctomycetes bacterium]|nr:DUF5615 family PIN-like protein [Planctomycetota bacterium]
MIRLLADHCFDEDILRALQRRAGREGLTLDVVLARDVGLARAKDPEVLAWAALNGRVVLSHDRNTLVGFAHKRTRSGLAMSGLIAAALLRPCRTTMRTTDSRGRPRL